MGQFGPMPSADQPPLLDAGGDRGYRQRPPGFASRWDEPPRG
jgi:hypothetical protein